MKQILLVIPAHDTKYTQLNNSLSELHHTPGSICRSSSVPESLSIIPDNIGIVLVDISLLAFDIHASLKALQTYFADIPIIVLADKNEKDVAVSAIKAGAQDVLVTGNYNTAQLENAISFAIERKKINVKNEYKLKEFTRQFDNGPIPMWIIDSATMKFLIVNNAAVEKYGYTKEEFGRMTIADIRPKEDVDQMLVQFNRKKSEFFDAGSWRHLKKNGELFYVNVYSHSTRFDHINARLSFVIDVNEQAIMDKRNLELTNRIKEQKAQLDNLLYSIGYAIWSRRADTLDIIYAYPNSAFNKLFGFTADEMVKDKKLFFNNIHPDDRKLVYDSLKEAIDKGSSEVVFRFTRNDGNVRTLKSQINLKIGTGDHPDTITGLTFDITKEKQLTDTIRNTELNLLATINNTKDMIWSVNTKLEIVFCNKAYQDVVYELAGIIPKPGDYALGEWGSETFFNTRKKNYERALAGESFTVFVEEYYDGSLLHSELSSNPIYDDNMNIVGVICIARDISEQKNQFVQIQHQNEKLREIAWIQSHKVRGPVASILGLASLFNDNPDAHESNLEILEKLKIATNDLDTIIKEVVDKTRNINP